MISPESSNVVEEILSEMAEAVSADVERDEIVQVLEAFCGHRGKVVPVQMQLLEKHLILEQPGGQGLKLVATQLDLLELGVRGNEDDVKVVHAAVFQVELPEFLHRVEASEAAVVADETPAVCQVG